MSESACESVRFWKLKIASHPKNTKISWVDYTDEDDYDSEYYTNGDYGFEEFGKEYNDNYEFEPKIAKRSTGFLSKLKRKLGVESNSKKFRSATLQKKVAKGNLKIKDFFD